jgi:hypothetical protein
MDGVDGGGGRPRIPREYARAASRANYGDGFPRRQALEDRYLHYTPPSGGFVCLRAVPAAAGSCSASGAVASGDGAVELGGANTLRPRDVVSVGGGSVNVLRREKENTTPSLRRAS